MTMGGSAQETAARACLVHIKKYGLSGQLEDYSGFYRYVRELCLRLANPYSEPYVMSLIEKKLRKLGMQGWVDGVAGPALYNKIDAILDAAPIVY